MNPTARIALNKSVLDLTQPLSMMITNQGGKYQLNLVMGIEAVDVPDTDKPDEDTKKNNRDAVVGRELFAKGHATINLTKVNDTDGTSNVVVVINASGGTKIPGTGDELFRLDLSKLKFEQ